MIEQSRQTSGDRSLNTHYRTPSLDGTGCAQGESQPTEAFVVISTLHSDRKEFFSLVGVQHKTPFGHLSSPMDAVRVSRTPVARYSAKGLAAEHAKALALVTELVDNDHAVKDPEGAIGALAGR